MYVYSIYSVCVCVCVCVCACVFMYEGTSKSIRTLFFKKSLFMLQTWERYFSI